MYCKYLLVRFVIICISLYPWFISAQEKVNKDSLNAFLLRTVFYGNYEKAENAIKQGADVDAVSDDGVSPIFYAVEKAYYKLAQLLIENKANVNFSAQDETGETPLIFATRLGHSEIVKLLLKNNANVNSKNNNGSTALHFAALYNDSAIVNTLLNYNASVDAINKKAITPLMFAASNGSTSVLKLLIENGANINSKDNINNTPLIYASANGQYSAAIILFENWAEINAANKNNYTALYFSITNNYHNITDLLLLNGANPNEAYSLSQNPLSIAKLYKQKNIADSLIKSGAKRNYLPSFNNKWGLGLSSRFNNRDFMLGIKYLAKDSKYNFEYSLYYNIRPFAIAVLQKADDNNYFQYWERRSMVGFSLGKLFEIYRKNNNYTGLFAEGLYEFNWGRYRGTKISINAGIKLKPCIGIEGSSKNTIYRISWMYNKVSTTGLKNWYLEFSLMYAFRKKRTGIDMQIFP